MTVDLRFAVKQQKRRETPAASSSSQEDHALFSFFSFAWMPAIFFVISFVHVHVLKKGAWNLYKSIIKSTFTTYVLLVSFCDVCIPFRTGCRVLSGSYLILRSVLIVTFPPTLQQTALLAEQQLASPITHAVPPGGTSMNHSRRFNGPLSHHTYQSIQLEIGTRLISPYKSTNTGNTSTICAGREMQ